MTYGKMGAQWHEPGAEVSRYDQDRRDNPERRAEVRCECGHGPMFHIAGERCYALDGTCACVEYSPKGDRRSGTEEIGGRRGRKG